jgi:hypothetical protein
MNGNERDEQRDGTPEWAAEEGSRASMAESEADQAGAVPEPNPQPGRAGISNRREPESPTGTVGRSDFPLTDQSHRR